MIFLNIRMVSIILAREKLSIAKRPLVSPIKNRRSREARGGYLRRTPTRGFLHPIFCVFIIVPEKPENVFVLERDHFLFELFFGESMMPPLSDNQRMALAIDVIGNGNEKNVHPRGSDRADIARKAVLHFLMYYPPPNPVVGVLNIANLATITNHIHLPKLLRLLLAL